MWPSTGVIDYYDPQGGRFYLTSDHERQLREFALRWAKARDKARGDAAAELNSTSARHQFELKVSQRVDQWDNNSCALHVILGVAEDMGCCASTSHHVCIDNIRAWLARTLATRIAHEHADVTPVPAVGERQVRRYDPGMNRVEGHNGALEAQGSDAAGGANLDEKQVHIKQEPVEDVNPPSGSAGSSTFADRPPIRPSDMPTRERLIECWLELEGLLRIYKERSAGGSGKSGRYKTDDSARMRYIKLFAYPLLRLGKFPPEEDMRMLKEKRLDEMGPGETMLKRSLKEWCDKFRRDPRTDRTRNFDLTEEEQTSILTYFKNVQIAAGPKNSSKAETLVGRPATGKIDFGSFKDMTVCEVAALSKTNHEKSKAASWFLLWCCDMATSSDGQFVWRMWDQTHLRLYLNLVKLVSSDGCVKTIKSDHDGVRIDYVYLKVPQRATKLFNDYFDKLLPEPESREDEKDPLEALEKAIQADNWDFDLGYPADEDGEEVMDCTASGTLTSGVGRKQNTVPLAQQAWFKEFLTSRRLTEYPSWEDLWVRAPNPTCLPEFDPKAYARLDTYFFSPALKWKDKGVGTPCPNHGWGHESHVRLYGRWRLRLVKGTTHDFCIASQDAICIACREEHYQARKDLDAAKAGKPGDRMLPSPRHYVSQIFCIAIVNDFGCAKCLCVDF